MIDLYTWTTPNGRKPLILLEELGLEYRVIGVDIGKGEQHAADYLKLNPNGKIPSLVDKRDEQRLAIFESGAIMIHLAERAGRFLPTHGQPRIDTLAWLMFQMASVGPMLGQAYHFLHTKEKVPYAIERYKTEARRIYQVLEKRLEQSEYLAGEYSIADMATYPWVRDPAGFELTLSPFPKLAAWLAALDARPAVQRAMTMTLIPLVEA